MKNTLKLTLSSIIAILMISIFSLTAFADSFSPSDEFMKPLPFNTMLKENGGLLFTTLLIGIALGIGGTLLVQHIRRKKKQ